MPDEEGDPIAQAYDLIESGNPEEAARKLRARLDTGRGGLKLRLTLAEALIAAGDFAQALEVARETTQLMPGMAVAALGVGRVLAAMELLPVAIAEFQRALRLDPDLDDAHVALGYAWLAAGETEKALEEFAQVQTQMPDVEAAILKAQAMQTQVRSDAGYVRHLFDQFSSDYDVRMRGQLGYRGPEMLRELAAMILPGAHDLRILDLGCGTGLAGAAFADIAAYIDGIDLSPRMVEKARASGNYRNLAVADIETFLAQSRSPYDLVLAADTLVYLGDLVPLFRGVARQLSAGKHFFFTVESQAGDGFALGPKRRWRHAGDYVRDVATRCNFEVDGMLESSARSEAGVPVPGFVFALSMKP